MEKLALASAPTIKGRTITGYAALFHSPVDRFDRMGRPFQLQFGKTAFDKAITPRTDLGQFNGRPNIKAFFNHDYNQILGDTVAGNLALWTDDKGLFYSLDLPQTTMGKDLEAMVAAGLVRGNSIGFNIVADDWQDELCTVQEAAVIEVGPNSDPADVNTTLNLLCKAKRRSYRNKIFLLDLALKEIDTHYGKCY